MQSWEGWDSLVRNQRLRQLQPDIIINNRSRLDEDFGTPEGHVTALDRDWEACMTFNDISWGYMDEEQALPYAYTTPRILKMLNTCANGGGNDYPDCAELAMVPRRTAVIDEKWTLKARFAGKPRFSCIKRLKLQNGYNKFSHILTCQVGNGVL